MFCSSFFIDIRFLEASIYGGPETAEHVFDREASFQCSHPSKRSLMKETTKNGEKDEDIPVDYIIRYNPETEDLEYEYL